MIRELLSAFVLSSYKQTDILIEQVEFCNYKQNTDWNFVWLNIDIRAQGTNHFI